jgi:hypothetical protein
MARIAQQLAKYDPIPIDVRMSDYGYWVVTLSLAPGLRLSVMICSVGISPERATELALGSYAHNL